ncbi:RING-H2 finger protein ATL34-like [Glycine soja]|uniref:RING-type E3 ubiquitin transferase n=1 Tax=Glycine soja TaxID=3848 RepID=A0A0B2RT92_GLYSO|nr:RING-H2 finger protein ATL34-like [Glycine soja]KHN35479.1 RING-H2 finger protein ATL11 [Glycine soja]RZB69561.1 RING-H2 finger protein ATL11 [Glycine soja]
MSMQKESPLIRLHSFDQGHAWLALLHLLIHISPAVTGQPVTPPVQPDSNKSVIAIMAIVVIMFLISAFLSLYSRKCSDRPVQTRGILDLAGPTGAAGNPLQAESNGLNQATIETFPTFLYADVKGLKIGKDTLACAVCLNEFEDNDTLRMIPKCCHVYHPDCIGAWLASHSTCPVCRANLVPQPEDMNTNTNTNMPSILSIQIPNEEEREHEHEHEYEAVIVGEEHKRDVDVESPKVDLLRRIRTLHHDHQSRPSRSKSTGFLSSLLFPRSNSMGQLAQHAGENYERFTLRLPEEVLRSQMVLKRANSCVCFTRMSSGTWGYRTRSVGRGCVQYERFGGENEQWGFTLTPPSLVRNSWNNNRSTRKSPVQRSGVALDNNNAGERSTEFLRLG